MFDAIMRKLPYPLDRASNLEVIVPEDTGVCGLPEFPEDSDEQITVLFRLSLNEFVALATAIDVGSDIAYGEDGLKVWYLWVASVMCAQFCEEMALCLENEDVAVVEALANLITNNQTIINAISQTITNLGSSVPGQPLNDQQANSDTLPENTRDGEGDCIPDALWGACLFLVQSGNRAITDFFEQVENASNTLETSAIVSQTIPAAGPYVSAAVEFADQLQENLAEGYAAAYTETYENELACDLFCLARENCELTPDMLMTVMAERLGYVEGTENFGTVMARIGVGVFIGPSIADSAFYIYFTALRFGQQFGDILGFRPLTDLMSLGADQLASDNWETLCDCPDAWERVYDFTVSTDGWVAVVSGQAQANWVSGDGWAKGDAPTRGGRITLLLDLASDIDVTSVQVKLTDATIPGDTQTISVYQNPLYTLVEGQAYSDDVLFTTPFTANEIVIDVAAGSDPSSPDVPGYLYEVVLTGTGTPPP